MSEESNSRQTYWPNARQTEELEKDRKILHLLIKKLDMHTKIKLFLLFKKIDFFLYY